MLPLPKVQRRKNSHEGPGKKWRAESQTEKSEEQNNQQREGQGHTQEKTRIFSCVVRSPFPREKKIELFISNEPLVLESMFVCSHIFIY